MKSILKYSLICSFIFMAIADADPLDTVIAQIRADYNATENANLKSQIIKLDEDAETVELKKYFTNGELVKLVFISGGDHGASTDSYYFKNGGLYFVFQSAGGWSFDASGPEGSTIDTGSEQRIYYQGDRAIRHLIKEVQSRDANQITKLLAKTDNRSVNNPEAANGLLNAGYRLSNVNSKAALERYLYQE